MKLHISIKLYDQNCRITLQSQFQTGFFSETLKLGEATTHRGDNSQRGASYKTHINSNKIPGSTSISNIWAGSLASPKDFATEMAAIALDASLDGLQEANGVRQTGSI